MGYPVFVVLANGKALKRVQLTGKQIVKEKKRKTRQASGSESNFPLKQEKGGIF